MQQLTFPKPTLAKGDFFSGGGIPPAPIPEALDVLAKYPSSEPGEAVTDIVDNVDPIGDTNEPTYLNGDPKIKEGIDDLLGKYKASDDVIDEPAPKPKAVEKTTEKSEKSKEAEVTADDDDFEPAAPVAPALTSTEFVEPTANLAEVANMLQEKGLIVEIPEGFPIEDVRPDNFWELINHNFNKKAEETFSTGYDAARKEIASGLSPEVLEMVNFQLENPNITSDEVKLHIEHIFWQKEISQLDPSSAIDAETIIRQYLAGSGEYTSVEVDEMVQEAKDLNRLEQRASQFKPKLELRLQQEAQRKQQERSQILEMEDANHQSFLSKVRGILGKGDINGIPLGNEEKSKLWGIFSNNKIPVPVPGGKTVEMGYMNFLVAKNMYAKDANFDNLMLAALILEGGPGALEKYVSAPAIKKEVAAFKSQAATGTFRSAPAAASNRVPTKPDTKTFFSRTLR